MKVRLLYIPTLTLNTKYAVLCDKCENGVYVEENDYLSLLDGKADISTESGEICLVRKNTDDKIYVEFSDNTDKAKDNKSTGKNTEPNDLSSSHFTSASAFQHHNRSADSSVPGVSKNHSHVERPSSPIPQRVIKCCPKCQMLYTSSKEKCSFCNSDLVVRV